MRVYLLGIAALLGPVAGVAAQAPPLEFVGTVVNTRLPTSPASLSIAFAPPVERLTGFIRIGAPLDGSGRFVGWRTGDTLFLRSISASGDTIVWTSPVIGSYLGGSYRITGGRYTGQSGIWNAQFRPNAIAEAIPPQRPSAAPTGACYESSITTPTPFMGNNGEVFRLADGSLWEVKYEYEYMYEYYPTVVICPSRGKLLVGKKSLNVAMVSAPPRAVPQAQPVPRSDVVESRIDGEFSGWEGETIFKLQNGQIWQQTSYAYKYVYKYSPEVLIYRSGGSYKMRVEGVDGEITVARIK